MLDVWLLCGVFCYLYGVCVIIYKVWDVGWFWVGIMGGYFWVIDLLFSFFFLLFLFDGIRVGDLVLGLSDVVCNFWVGGDVIF